MTRAGPTQAWTNVILRGPLFEKKINTVVKRALVQQCMERLDKEMTIKTERLKRKGGKWPSGRRKGLGAKRNIVTAEKAFGMTVAQELKLTIESTTKSPRTKGTMWVRKNVAWMRKMAPRILKKAANQVVGELS